MTKLGGEWLGRKIISNDDHDDLETRAAIHTFHSGLPRHEAEEKAYQDYKRDKLIDSASHHLKGLKAAHAIGDLTAAKKHGMMYMLALKGLKHDDGMNPPKEVLDRHENMPKEFQKFKAHPADLYLIEDKDESKDN